MAFLFSPKKFIENQVCLSNLSSPGSLGEFFTGITSFDSLIELYIECTQSAKQSEVSERTRSFFFRDSGLRLTQWQIKQNVLCAQNRFLFLIRMWCAKLHVVI